jgi:hypothetical protein
LLSATLSSSDLCSINDPWQTRVKQCDCALLDETVSSLCAWTWSSALDSITGSRRNCQTTKQKPWPPSQVHEEIVKQTGNCQGSRRWEWPVGGTREFGRQAESGAGKSEERERERTGGAESDLWRSAPSDLVMWVAARLESWLESWCCLGWRGRVEAGRISGKVESYY